MGLLDKLMFWRKDTVELDYDVNGCFTLPEAAEVDVETAPAENADAQTE